MVFRDRLFLSTSALLYPGPLFARSSGAGDLLEVQGPGLKTTVFLPFTKAAVPTVDLAAGRIIADQLAGLVGDDPPSRRAGRRPRRRPGRATACPGLPIRRRA
jgi:hypothetical protein